MRSTDASRARGPTERAGPSPRIQTRVRRRPLVAWDVPPADERNGLALPCRPPPTVGHPFRMPTFFIASGISSDDRVPPAVSDEEGQLLRWLSRMDIHTHDAVLAGGPFLGRATETVEALADLDLPEPDRAQDVQKLCHRQSAGNSTRPEVDITPARLIEVNAEHDVAVEELASGHQHTEQDRKSVV